MVTRLLLLLLAFALLRVVGAAEPAYPRARPLTDRTFESLRAGSSADGT